MIEINLGNIGSGKTACVVRDLVMNRDKRVTFSNIITPKLKHNKLLNIDMIVKKETFTNKKGKPEEREVLNKEFWVKAKKKYKSMNVIIDEAHEIFNSRDASKTRNKIFSSWLALLRRVIGSSDEGYGKLILITQLDRRIDVNGREMGTMYKYHRCTYTLQCQNKKCGYQVTENNETSKKHTFCPSCGHHRILPTNHIFQIWEFENGIKYHQ